MAFATKIRLLLLVFLPSIAASAFGGSLDPIRNDIRSGELQRALSEISRVLRREPSNNEARLLQAQVQSELGRKKQAIDTLKALIKSDPKLTVAYNNLAVFYAQQGKLDMARKTLENGIQSNKTYATLHGNLTELYERMAQEAYGKALDLKSRKSAPKLTSLWEMDRPLVVAKADIAEARSATNPVKQESKPKQPVTKPKLEPRKPVVKAPDKVEEPELVATLRNGDALTGTATTKAKPPATTRRDETTKVASIAASSARQASAERSRTVGPIRRLLGWARAWSSKDPDGYIRFYSRNYKPEDMSRNAWKAQRRSRISKPKWIKVDINEFRAKPLSEDRVEIEFRQLYKSDRFNSKVRKKVQMINEGDGWVIAHERVTARE